MNRHILFDLDGTLTDPKVGILTCINHALEQLGRGTLPIDELEWCIGPPLQGSFRTLLATEDEELVTTAVERYRDRFSTTGLYENNLYEGIPDLLSQLCDRGDTLYVATSKPALYARQIIEHFGLGSFFRNIYGSELDGTRSDKKELLAWVLQQEGLADKEVWMIGDREHDMIGAVANDVRPVGVLWGYGSGEELAGAGALHLCNQPDELVTLLMK